MNKFTLEIINRFLHPQNIASIGDNLCNKFKYNINVKNYLNKSLHRHAKNYSESVGADFMYTKYPNRIFTDEYRKMIPQQVTCMNVKFTTYMIEFINSNVLNTDRVAQLTNANVVSVNDGLNASARSIVDTMPRTQLRDTNTTAVDDPALHFSNRSQSYMMQVQNGSGIAFRRGTNSSDLSRANEAKVLTSADAALQRQRYAYRAPQIRDDPVGGIVRDRGDAHVVRDVIAPVDRRVSMSTEQTDAFIKSQRMNQDQPKILANTAIDDGHSYNGAADTVESGTYENMFTGESAEYSNTHTDRLLSTKYIQNLNQTRGQAGRPDPTLSTFDRGRRAGRDVTVEGMMSTANPQNNIKAWKTGDGFVDESNTAEMKHLRERRIFRTYNAKKRHGMNTKSLGDEAGDQFHCMERGLYKRNYERDAEENVGGFEMDNLQRGYGEDARNEQLCRVPNKYPCGRPSMPMPGGYNQEGGKAVEDVDGQFSFADGDPTWEFRD